MKGVSGRGVLVTGGASGIGRAIVTAFHEAGANVAFCDIDKERGASLAQGLDRPVARCLFVPADVGSRAQVEFFVATAARELGRIDVLVNNAGITHDRTDFGDLDLEVWNRILNVNLNGACFAAKAALPHLIRQSRGAIVNIGSVLAEAAFPGKVAYITSKAAVAGFSKALAIDLADRSIRVNCVIPGSIDTEMMWRGVGAEEKDAVAAAASADIPLSHVGSPEELASVVLFLASDAAAYVTGTSLLVDGGLLTRIAASR